MIPDCGETPTRDRDNIRFNVLRNALYHTARRRSLERCNRIFNFLVVILGATAVGGKLTEFGIGVDLIGFGVAVIGALQLVFDFGRQARDHQSLQRDYYTLLAEIERKPVFDEAMCAEWLARMISITADEPPTLRALDAKAYNDALDAGGDFDPDQRLKIPLHHSLLGGFLAFEGYNYKKFSELN